MFSLDEHYALYFTSTSPQHLRLTMINAEPTDKITMEIFYAISNRYLSNSHTPANASGGMGVRYEREILIK